MRTRMIGPGATLRAKRVTDLACCEVSRIVVGCCSHGGQSPGSGDSLRLTRLQVWPQFRGLTRSPALCRKQKCAPGCDRRVEVRRWLATANEKSLRCAL